MKKTVAHKTYFFLNHFTVGKKKESTVEENLVHEEDMKTI